MSEGYDPRLKKKKKVKKTVTPAGERVEFHELDAKVEAVRDGLVAFLKVQIQYMKLIEEEFEAIHNDIQSSFRRHEATKDELIVIQRRLATLETGFKGYEYHGPG